MAVGLIARRAVVMGCASSERSGTTAAAGRLAGFRHVVGSRWGPSTRESRILRAVSDPRRVWLLLPPWTFASAQPWIVPDAGSETPGANPQ